MSKQQQGLPAPFTVTEAWQLFRYREWAPGRGHLYRRIPRGRYGAGTRVGRLWQDCRDGRVSWRLRYGEHEYSLANVIYYMHTTIWPEYPGQEIDHVNGNTLDNTPRNLVLGTHADNCRNMRRSRLNTSGRTGVTYDGRPGRRKRWRAGIKVSRKFKHLGYFHTLEEAAAARQAAEREYGFHPNHGAR